MEIPKYATSRAVIRRVEILGDNKMSFILIKDLESYNYTKHINVIYDQVRIFVKDRELGIEWIPSSSMLTDGLTKGFSIESF